MPRPRHHLAERAVGGALWSRHPSARSLRRLAPMLRFASLLVALVFVGVLPASAQRATPAGSAPALGVLVSHSTSARSPVAQAVA
ncbi:MAG TPA: hypothetical protein VMM35_13100, partial [Longimicrobiales bacterium]|nr:hypothetical protein [Longimicrobiales bacterium]